MLTAARVGTRDIKRAIAFYDRIAAELGAERVTDRHGLAGWSGPSGVLFMVGTPREGEANSANGSQVMFAAPNRAVVDSVHALALSMGGTCEGPPGPRGTGDNGLYAAYFRDLDGNKIMVLKVD